MEADHAFDSEEEDTQTDILEVWFAGCHCDVGGGSVSNKIHNSLARIPLRWMIRQCFLTHSGIMFDSDALVSAGINPSHLYPTVRSANGIYDEANSESKRRPDSRTETFQNLHGALGHDSEITLGRSSSPELTLSWTTESSIGSSTGLVPNVGSVAMTDQEIKRPVSLTLIPPSEVVETIADARSEMVDQLNKRWMWWILEWLPLLHRVQNEDLKWTYYLRYDLCPYNCSTLMSASSINRAQAREIPHQQTGFNVHRSVKLRMELENDYKPVPVFKSPPTWVD